MLFIMENLKLGREKAEDFGRILMALVMMENLKVEKEKAEEF